MLLKEYAQLFSKNCYDLVRSSIVNEALTLQNYVRSKASYATLISINDAAAHPISMM